MARYRLRTWLRGHAPWVMNGLFPLGSRDCGAHQWHYFDGVIDGCYHCVATRPYTPQPVEIGSFEWVHLLDGVVKGSDAHRDILVNRLQVSQRSVGLAAHETLAAIRAAGFDEDDPATVAAIDRLTALERATEQTVPEEAPPFPERG